LAFTVDVVGIFTGGALGSGSFEEASARLIKDVNNANQVWRNGFPGETRCEINFRAVEVWNYSNVTINANSINSSDALKDGSEIDKIIKEVRDNSLHKVAIYVIYLSGDSFSNGSIGVGGPRFTFFRNTNDYGLVGHVAMTNTTSTNKDYVFAHEAGHVLFGRFTLTRGNTLVITDPSTNPPMNHNPSTKNIMHSPSPSTDPLINDTQCITARQSRVVLENVGAPILPSMGPTLNENPNLDE